MRYLPHLLILALIGGLAWSCADTSRWEQDKARVLEGVRAREVSADSLTQIAESLFEHAERSRTLAERTQRLARVALFSANSLRDSVLALGTPPDTCLKWVALFQREADTLRAAVALGQSSYDTLLSAYTARGRTITLLLTSDSLKGASVDSLQALVGRVPRRKWWVPEVQVGYGAVVSGGRINVGPSLSVGFRLPVGRQ